MPERGKIICARDHKKSVLRLLFYYEANLETIQYASNESQNIV